MATFKPPLVFVTPPTCFTYKINPAPLQKFMLEHGYTVHNVSREAGIQVKTLKNILNSDYRFFHYQTVCKLADFLKTTPDQLIVDKLPLVRSVRNKFKNSKSE